MAEAYDAKARLIIPASPEVRRETGIVWFEAGIEPKDATVHLAGFAERGHKLAESMTRTDPDNTLRTVISHADGQLTIEMKGTRADSGDVVIRGRIGGHEFTISPKQDEPHMTVVLAPAEREVLKPWQGIASSLEALAHATREHSSADAPSFECDACLLVGAAVVHAAEGCVGGFPAQCSVLIDAWDTFRDNCEPPPCH